MRTPRNVYILENEEQCYMIQIDESLLWQRRMGHLNFNNLVKVNKMGAVKNLPKIIKPMSQGSPDLNLEVRNSANLIEKIKFVLIRVEIRLCNGFNCRPWSTFLRVWISMPVKLQIDSRRICSSVAASCIALPRAEHSATWKDFAVTSGERSQIRTIIEFSPVLTVTVTTEYSRL